MPVCRCVNIMWNSYWKRIESKRKWLKISRVCVHIQRTERCTFYDFIHKDHHRHTVCSPMDHRDTYRIQTHPYTVHTEHSHFCSFSRALLSDCVCCVCLPVWCCQQCHRSSGGFYAICLVAIQLLNKEKTTFWMLNVASMGVCVVLCCCCLIWYGDKLETMKW